MRNLLLFLARFHLFFVFVALQIISFTLYIQHNHYQKAIFLSTSNEVTGNFFEGVSSVEEYFSLQSENQKLQQENAQLRALLQESQYIDTATFTLKTDTSLHQKYLYIPAEVVRNTTHLKNNYMTLNVGSRHGIKEDMGVISPQGVVGIVHKVSTNFCTVISLLNSYALIPPKIDSVLNNGSIKWDGKDARYAVLKDINMHVPLKEGMEIVTSNLSKVFPENIPIGTLEEAYVPQGENFYDTKVKLHTNFENLHKVYVVHNLYAAEQDTLERKSNIDAK
jgi:rod shape-determining protein MreC